MLQPPMRPVREHVPRPIWRALHGRGCGCPRFRTPRPDSAEPLREREDRPELSLRNPGRQEPPASAYREILAVSPNRAARNRKDAETPNEQARLRRHPGNGLPKPCRFRSRVQFAKIAGIGV